MTPSTHSPTTRQPIRASSQALPLALLALALWLPAVSAQARSHDYQIDPVHSRIVVRAEHLGFSKAQGTLSGPTGWLRFDPKDLASAQVEVTLDLSRVDFGDAKWNQKLAGRTWLDQSKHPQARFVSERIEPIDNKRFVVHGQLSFRGQTRPVQLDVTFNRLARHPLTLKRTAGFSATATLSRAAFEMDAWKSMVSDEIELLIEVEALRKRRPKSTDTHP